jgi:hypothetical protein
MPLMGVDEILATDVGMAAKPNSGAGGIVASQFLATTQCTVNGKASS